MKDVARRAGVSQSTVSFVLNGLDTMRISAETRRRVAEAAEALGYRPRSAGRPPNAAEHRVIGMLVDEISTSPFAAISVEGVQEAAWKEGAIVEVAMSGGDRAYEAAILRRWAAAQVDGIVMASILTREISAPAPLLSGRTVLLNCVDADRRLPSVVPAERRGGEAATRALISEGHRRIAFIAGEPWMDAARQRLEGYRRALVAHGLAVDETLIVEGNFLPSGGYAATRRLMETGKRPDAILCANDLTAVGCYEALKERGERIGETIAVMGYDDQEIAQHLSPPLSTVLLPHREMGHWCARALLAPSGDAPEQFRMACPLVLRDSHRAAPQTRHQKPTARPSRRGSDPTA